MDGVVRGRSMLWMATAIIVSVFATLLVMQEWRAEASHGSDDATWVPMAPCRLFDFRSGPDNVGPKDTPLGPGDSSVYTQSVTGSNGDCMIPSDAVGVSMNVTIANPTHQSNLRVYPADVSTPDASNLNWLPGQSPTPNKVDVKLSPDGKIKLYNFKGTVNVIGDAVGYYTHASLEDINMRLKALEDAPPPPAPLWAVVDQSSGSDTCTLVRGEGAVSVEKVGASRCDVKFNKDVSDCVVSATVREWGLVEAKTYSDTSNPDPSGLLKEEIFVATSKANSDLAERKNFYLVVHC